MIAIKDNREYTITEVDVKSFQNEGYDIYDDNGNLVAYGVGKMVAYEKYAELLEKFERKNDEIVALRDEIEKLEAKLKAKKKKGTE